MVQPAPAHLSDLLNLLGMLHWASQIFQDLLRQYSGDRDEAMRMMAQLGLEFDDAAVPSPQPQMPIPSAPESPSLSFLSAPAMSNVSSDSRPSMTEDGFPDEIPGARHLLEPAFVPSPLPMGLSAVPESSSVLPSDSSRPPAVANGIGSSSPSMAPLTAVRPPTRSNDGGGLALLRTYQVTSPSLLHQSPSPVRDILVANPENK